MADLLMGCGNSRDRIVSPSDRIEWSDLVTVDLDPNCGADVVFDLSTAPLPFKDEQFEEVHAYRVLACLAYQGDIERFFEEWNEYWRILVPGGYFVGSAPHPNSRWTWGDPGNKRAIQPETLSHLMKQHYDAIDSGSATADYRRMMKGFWIPIWDHWYDEEWFFVMQKGEANEVS